MAIPRISLAWLVLLILIGILFFFTYHIGRTIYSQSEPEPMIENKPRRRLHMEEEDRHSVPRESASDESDYEPPSGSRQEARGYPSVPGQTEEDLRATDPIQATAPAHRYQPPGPKDPHAGPAHEPAEFGDNLRHPEGAFEMRSAPSDGYIAASGMGSAASSPGGNSAIGYSSETAQNAGEFMKGIFAFDGSMEGTAYSAL